MGFCIPLMLVNLVICWIWLTFIGMRLFGPGRKITNSENVGNDDDKNGYTNYALELDSKEAPPTNDYSSSDIGNNKSGLPLNSIENYKSVREPVQNGTDKGTSNPHIYVCTRDSVYK